MFARDQCGVHTNRNLIIWSGFSDRKKFDDVIDVVSHLDVARRNLRDSLAINIVNRNSSMECKSGENRRFCGGIVSIHICTGIRFSKSKILRFFQSKCELTTSLIHFGQNVICSSIDDTHDAVNMIANNRFTKRSKNRNRSADSRLVVQVYAILIGRFK